MKVRAALLETMGKQPPYTESLPLTIQELDLAPPGSGEVLVKIHAAGVCHSDLSVIDGNRARPMPMVLGHEASGIIEEVGPNVDRFAVGDRVVFSLVPSCGHCVPCSEGRPVLCEEAAVHSGAGELMSGERRLSRAGQPVNHLVGVSAFAEYSVVSENSLVKVPEEIPFDVAALFGCAVITGVGSVMNTNALKLGGTVAVIGLGGVGLSAVLGAVAAGAERIIAIDRLEDKLAFARQIGATDTFLASDDSVWQEIREATRGGVDLAVELAGSVKAIELAYAITRRGGTTVTVGLPNPQAVLTLPALSLVAEERTLKGSYVGSAVARRDLPRLMALYARGRLPVDRLMTHKLQLEDINLAMERLRVGEAIRQVIEFS